MEQSFKGADGKNYDLSPLTLGDMRRFTHFAQYREWERFYDSKDILPAEEFAAESERLMRACAAKRLTESSPEVVQLWGSLDGGVYLLYLSLKKKHPNITHGQVADLLTMTGLAEATEKLMVVSGMGDAPNVKKKATRLISEPSTKRAQS